MSLPFIRHTEPVYRAHHPRWAFDPTSSEGARRHGGRFNRPKTPAIYTSTRMETAWLEAQQGFAFKAQPLTLCSYAVDCADILDLTIATIQAAVGVSPADMACAWEDLSDRGLEVPSWALADRLIKQGAAGIIVPSYAHRARPYDRSLIFWRWAAGLPHRVCVIDDQGRLPRNDSS